MWLTVVKWVSIAQTRNYFTRVRSCSLLYTLPFSPPQSLLTFPQRDNVVGLLGGRTDAQLVHGQQAEAVDGEGCQAGHLIWCGIGACVDACHLIPDAILTLAESRQMHKSISKQNYLFLHLQLEKRFLIYGQLYSIMHITYIINIVFSSWGSTASINTWKCHCFTSFLPSFAVERNIRTKMHYENA